MLRIGHLTHYLVLRKIELAVIDMFYGLKGGSFTPVIAYKNTRNKILSGISQDYKKLLRPKTLILAILCHMSLELSKMLFGPH